MLTKISKWFPSLLIMLVIFIFSSQPSEKLPDFHWADSIVKKGGHMFGYGLLAVSYWNGFGWAKRMRPFAWALAIIYAITDELHQSFVPGRHPSVWDVLIFDNLGALISLWFAGLYIRRERLDGNV
ncbi:MAG TPA: VanZ family protein [Anaerolineales bacterium]